MASPLASLQANGATSCLSGRAISHCSASSDLRLIEMKGDTGKASHPCYHPPGARNFCIGRSAKSLGAGWFVLRVSDLINYLAKPSTENWGLYQPLPLPLVFQYTVTHFQTEPEKVRVMTWSLSLRRSQPGHGAGSMRSRTKT